MAKTIEFTYNDEDYTLEFTRKVVRDMEAEGFSFRKMNDAPATFMPRLFEGAFRLHHRKIKKELINEIYKHIPDKQDLMEALVEMYNDAVDTLFEEPEESEKNVQWKKSNF